MVLNALVAWLHYLGFMVLFGALLIEWLLCRPGLRPQQVRALVRADAGVGLAAALILITGILRVFYFGKGVGFYIVNPIFLLKVGLFFAVGLLSIYPTVVFLGWRRAVNNNQPAITAERINRLAAIIRIELAAVIALPLLAALMARGVGL